MTVVNIFRGPTLAVAQKSALKPVQQLSRQTLVGARRLAPRGSHLSGSGQRHPGKVLQSSLKADVRVGTQFVQSKVGSDAQHAATMHQGSKPHTIVGFPNDLKFRWERGTLLVKRTGRRFRQRGGFFYFIRVRHPGNKRPVRYLTTPLHQFGRALNFLVTSVPVSRTRLP